MGCCFPPKAVPEVLSGEQQCALVVAVPLVLRKGFWTLLVDFYQQENSLLRDSLQHRLSALMKCQC